MVLLEVGTAGLAAALVLVGLGIAAGVGWRRSSAARATELAALRAELDAARTRSAALIDASHDLLCRYDLQGGILELSPAGARLLGYSAGDVRQLREIVDARFLPLLIPSTKVRQGGAPVERSEVLARTSQGAEIWLSARVRTILDDGQVVGAEMVADDVTAVRAAREGLTAHSRAGDALARVVSGDATLERALETLVRELDFDYVELWQLHEAYDLMKVETLWHVENALLERSADAARRRTVSRGMGLAGRVWVLEVPLYFPDLDQCPQLRTDFEAEEHFRSGLAFPVRQGGRVGGVIVLMTIGRFAQRTPPVELLDTLGSQIGHFAERRRSEERLKQSEARIRMVLESTVDGVVTADREGRILDFNRSAESTFGYARSDVLGRLVDEVIIPTQLRGEHRDAFARYLETGERRLVGRIESVGVRADGNEIPIELAVTPSQAGAEPIFTAFVRDISHRKQLERLKDELVSTVSHELRTPLASVRGFVELLLMREYPPEKQRHFLTIIDSEIKRLTRLINDFLDLQRLESGEENYALEEQDLCALVRQCAEIAAGSTQTHGFEVDLPKTVLSVRIDGDRIQQVLMNLMSNAVKFSPDGGTVRVCASAKGDRVVVSIRDQGIGMPPDVVRKLFRKFYRADSSTTQAIQGTGLGLALVREIVSTHQGEVWVESQVGSGSEFFFSLPLAGGPGKEPQAEDQAEA